MNDERLRIYLTDHLAVVVGELELAKRCKSENEHLPLGDFLRQLVDDLHQQRSIMVDALHRVGGSESTVKQGMGWLSEKLGRLKMNDSLLSYSPLGRLYEIEALSAAALERVMLWDNLQSTRRTDPRMSGLPFLQFRQQSEQHVVDLHEQRQMAVGEAI